MISSSGKKDFVGRFSYTGSEVEDSWPDLTQVRSGSRDYTAFCAIKEAFK